MESDPCPACHNELAYTAENGKWYSRKVGVEVRDVYDGALFWMCPDCNHKWHRWTEDTRPDLVRKAERYVDTEA